MRITSVEKSKGNNNRFSVYIDGSYAFSIFEEDYLRLGLYEEREISSDEIDYIRNVVNFNSAKSDAIKYLALRIRTEKEVAAKLEEKGYDAKTVLEVIEELNSMGYLNDRMYVQKFLFDRSKLKPKSKKVLKFELQNKGVRAEIIDEVMDDWELDEEAIAEKLAKKKFGKYDMEDERVIKRIYSFLLHRGFSYELASSVLKKLKSGSE